MQVASPSPYKLKITGTNFHQGVVVYVASDMQPWAGLKFKSDTTLVLKGSGLKQKFPKGVAVPIRVVNPDTGEDTISFTR